MKRCATTGKLRYRTEVDAMLALMSTGRREKTKRQERRQYRCPHCNGWHLTSQALKAN